MIDGIPLAPLSPQYVIPVFKNHPQFFAEVFHCVLQVRLREFAACALVGRRAAALWSPSSRRDFDARNIGESRLMGAALALRMVAWVNCR
jgi:hypothetical protein